MKLCIVLMMVIYGLWLTSCDDTQSDTQQSQHIDNEQPQVDTSLRVGISPANLKSCLPLNFRGATKLPSSSGTMTIEGIKVSKTTGEYIYPGGTITITMADYAGAAGTISHRYEMPTSSETGMVIQKIILPNGVGYSRYSNYESVMQLYCLLQNRVAVEIIATGDESWFSDQSIVSTLIPSECIDSRINTKK